MDGGFEKGRGGGGRSLSRLEERRELLEDVADLGGIVRGVGADACGRAREGGIEVGKQRRSHAAHRLPRREERRELARVCVAVTISEL